MKVKFKNPLNANFSHFKHVASADNLRPIMCGVNINLKQSRLECTDAHILVSFPIEITENDSDTESFVVPLNFFNHLRYMVVIDKKLLTHLEYVLSEDYAEVYFADELVFRCRYIDGKFPNIDKVLPTAAWVREKVEEIGLNFSILKRLTNGLPFSSPNNYKLSLYAKNKCVFVESNNEDLKGVFGLIKKTPMYYLSIREAKR